MADTFFVHILNCLEHLLEDLLRVAFIVALSHYRDLIKNFSAFYVLHDLEDFAFERIFEDFDRPYYVFVIEPTQNVKLIFMSSEFFFVIVPDNLDCKAFDVLIEDGPL